MKKTTYTCDNNRCDHEFEQEPSVLEPCPEGWLELRQRSKHDFYTTSESRFFCSVPCLQTYLVHHLGMNLASGEHTK